jgi:hypothetical protein
MVAAANSALWGYVLMHPEAKLTPAETEQLIAGLRATFGGEAAKNGRAPWSVAVGITTTMEAGNTTTIAAPRLAG